MVLGAGRKCSGAAAIGGQSGKKNYIVTAQN